MARAIALLAFPCLLAAHAVAAQTPATAQQVFESRRPAMLRAAPDEVLDQLRSRIGDLFRSRSLAPAFQDPFTRRVDTLVEQPWPALRRRCFAHAPPLSVADALDASDALLAESGFAGGAAPSDLRGDIAAMLAGLDQRICRCADKSSLALAADCAS